MTAMASRNPLIDPPRFPSPEVYGSDSPSPKRSPARHSRNFSKSGDTLLRNLSPSSTLRAFTEGASGTGGKSEDQLTRSIEAASNSERVFGARIAQTCRDIRVWHAEVETWKWPGTFEPPSETEKLAQAQRMLEDHPIPLDTATLSNRQEGAQLAQFWGCLPGFIIVLYEKRVEDIRDELDDLDVDSLKEYVLSAHVHNKPHQLSDLDGSATRDGPSLKPQHLDDFTTLITATILQALPYLSRLNKLLNSWSVRLIVLRKIPGYTRELEHAQVEVESGWSDMSKHMDAQQFSTESDLAQLWTKFQSIRDALERKVMKLGARLDSMLDDLEGRDETLPDRWIDAFENLETAYGEWVTQTERELTGQRLRLMRQSRAVQAQLPKDGATIVISEVPEVVKEDGHHDLAEAAAIPVSLGDDASDSKAQFLQPGMARAPSEETLAPDAHFSAPLEQVESSVLGNGRMPKFGAAHSEKTLSDSDGDEPLATKTDAAETIQRDPLIVDTSLSRSSSIQADQSPTIRSPFRSRHVPIFVDYEDIRATSAPEVVTEDMERVSFSSRQTSLSSVQPTPVEAGGRVRARAAFLNGGVEKSQSLQKTVSPPIVRPFEHASQAFTKLFQRSNSVLHSRSSSTSSRSSLRKGLGLGIKQDTERTHHRSNPSVSSNRSFHDSNIPVDPAEVSELSAEETPYAANTTAELPQPTDPIEKPVSDRDSYVTPETQYGFEPSTRESKSTIESAWTSPALSDFPDNWPLPMGKTEEEISSPRKPLDSNFFEKMFVDSLPTTPNEIVRTRSQEENPLERMMTFNSRSSISKEPPLNNVVLSSSQRRIEGGEGSSPSPAGSRPGSRPGHMRIGSNSAMQRWVDPISEGTTPGSFKSDLSTPSVHDASAAEYFKSQEVETPPPVSRTSSVTTARIGKSPQNQVLPSERDAQFSPKSLQAEFSFFDEKDALMVNERVPLLKRGSRASITSIEKLPRSQLKTIDIPDVIRTPSFSASQSPISPVSSVGLSSPTFDPPSPDLQYNRQYALSDMPTPVLSSSAEPNSTPSKFNGSKAPPLNVSMPKRRNEPVAVLQSSPSSIKSANAKAPISQTTPIKKIHKRSESTAEQLDRHVSRVLSSLPARIRFTPVSSTLGVENNGTPNLSSGSKGRPSLGQRVSKTSLTLSPAQSDLSSHKKASANDPEVKLYHLTQEGKEQPIKLYVRLVGENERVMVRVGGGWADLGEYLRQYAEHHGRRTVSDGRFEIQGVAANGGSMKVGTGPKLRTPLSRPGSVLDRPSSALSHRRSSMGLSQQTPNDSVSSPFSSPNPGLASTPTASNSSGSRPATADDARPTSPGSWNGAEVSLAGPSSKKVGGLDEKKARWVEDMIGRAKQASTEKKKTEEKSWGEMGKIGGTRRIIFKHQKPEAGNA